MYCKSTRTTSHHFMTLRNNCPPLLITHQINSTPLHTGCQNRKSVKTTVFAFVLHIPSFLQAPVLSCTFQHANSVWLKPSIISLHPIGSRHLRGLLLITRVIMTSIQNYQRLYHFILTQFTFWIPTFVCKMHSNWKLNKYKLPYRYTTHIERDRDVNLKKKEWRVMNNFVLTSRERLWKRIKYGQHHAPFDLLFMSDTPASELSIHRPSILSVCVVIQLQEIAVPCKNSFTLLLMYITAWIKCVALAWPTNTY